MTYLQPLADVGGDEVHQSEFRECTVSREHQILAVEKNEVHLRGNEQQPRSRYNSSNRPRSQLSSDLQSREHQTSCSEAHRSQSKTEAPVLLRLPTIHLYRLSLFVLRASFLLREQFRYYRISFTLIC